jgi:predicted DNA-binding transcriptional regulator YafY
MTTSARMLQLLSLLQTHRYWPGGELATRLEVSARTLRRDIDRLRELGYDVDAVRGQAGGYQLRAGNALPPLLLEDEEAVAIAVGLRTSAAGAVQGMEGSALQALTKVVALMPPRLRRRMDALQSQTVPAPWRGPSIDAHVLTTLAQACRDDEVVRFSYASRDGERSRRYVEPHQLVSIGSRWYLVGHDRDRHDWRTFRVDRVSDPELGGTRFRPRTLPAEDALAFVRQSFSSMPTRHRVRVRFAAEAATVAGFVGRWATVAPVDGGCVMTMGTDTLDWPMFVLANVDAPFTVEEPDELVDLVAGAARRFREAAAS